MLTPTPQSFWDERFSPEVYAYGERASRLLHAHRDAFAPGMTALVPGCGEGRDAVFLAKCGLNVTAVDLSASGLRKAKALAERHSVSVNWVQADLSEWDWGSAQYDIIASIFIHTPSQIRKPLHHTMLNSLRPGGQVYLEGFTKDQIAYQESHGSGGPDNPDMLFDPADLQDDFKEAEQRALWIGTEHLDEGPYHTGSAALVRAVFKKREA